MARRHLRLNMSSLLVLLEKRGYKPYSGAELATHLILKLLADEGFDITIVTGMSRFETTKGVKFIYSPLFDVPSKVHLWAKLLKSRPNWLSELIKENNMVYIPRLAYPVIPLAEKYGKKVVVHLHDYQPITYSSAIFDYNIEGCNTDLLGDMKRNLQFEILENESIWRAILSSLATPLNKFSRLWVGEADEIICVSKRQREIIGSITPELVGKLRVIYNPLPKVPIAEKRLGDPTIMFMGGDSYVKGFHIFLKASLSLLKQDSNVKFLLAGVLKNANRSLIEKLNKRFKGAFNLLGRLKHEKILKFHSISRALIFPSISEEPSPYVVSEAMLHGTIPIASKVGGVPEIVQGSFAEKMLFQPGDVEELVDKMEATLTMSNEQIIDIGGGLRESVLKRFDVETTRNRFLELFLP